MQKYSKYSDQQYKELRQMAMEVNLVDFLRAHGVHLIPKGKEFCTEEHDSLSIPPDKSCWRQYSKIGKNGKVLSGNNIDYLVRFENYSPLQAIEALVEYAYGPDKLLHLSRPPDIRARNAQVHINAPVIKEPGKLPEKETQNLRQLYGYLCGKPPGRCLDPDIVRDCVKAGSVFLSRKPLQDGKTIHNVVFVGFDKQRQARYAFERGTTTGSSYKHELDWSDKSYGFRIGGSETSQKAYFFEAPIDALSAATMIKEKGGDWKKDPLVSLSGVSDNAVARFVKENPNIKKLCFCLDNDEAGNKASHALLQKYASLGYEVTRGLPKVGKDFNETLQAHKAPQGSTQTKPMSME